MGGFYAVNARAPAFNSKGTGLVNNEVTMKPYVRHPWVKAEEHSSGNTYEHTAVAHEPTSSNSTLLLYFLQWIENTASVYDLIMR